MSIDTESTLSESKRMSIVSLASLPSVDFSYKKLTTIQDLNVEHPRIINSKRTPSVAPNNKYNTSGVWLNNNEISDIYQAVIIIERIVQNPEFLSWIDLSNNQITEINETFFSFPLLRMLYLHENDISNLEAIEGLKDVTTLRSLTLAGNPLYLISDYKEKVCSMFPQITSLDFSSVRKST